MNNSVSYKRSLLIGMLLGCASSRLSVATKQRKATFIVKHPFDQSDLLAWKAGEIERLFSVQIHYVQCQTCFSFTARRRVRIIHQWFHRGQQKAITPKIRFMDHPIGLAMLLCDVGYVRRQYSCPKPNITLAVAPFLTSERLLLLTHIQALSGAEGYIKTVHYMPEIWFDFDNSQIIWNLTQQWLPQVGSMQNKFQAVIQSYGK